jgi:IclR family acetate operon transcriptional repressor
MPRASGRIVNVRAVDRAIDILQCFSAEQPVMSVLDIQEKVPLSRPTLYRLLHTLAAKGLVRVEGDPQRFSLDYGVGRLAHSWMSGIDPIAVGRPILERLRQETGETVALFMLRGHLRLCLLELTTPNVLKIARGVGETEHIGRGASGKAMLAFMATDEVARILPGLPAGIDRKRLLADLARVRSDGFAVSRGEVFVGAVAVAAPYFDSAHRVLGSIGAFGPAARLDAAWVTATIDRMVAGARALSAHLGDPVALAAQAAHAPSARKRARRR